MHVLNLVRMYQIGVTIAARTKESSFKIQLSKKYIKFVDNSRNGIQNKGFVVSFCAGNL